VFTTLNQVGGGLGDYMSQASIEGGTPLKVIDGYGGLLGYDLELIDTASGPIRERVYEIIRANLEPGSLLLDSLRQINAVKDMPLYEWVIEMDAIYFDINPEMGLQAQQDFQTLVYEHLYTIISFLLLFQQYASDYEFFQQFLNNDGVPFRMQASVYLQQLRIALTARCGHFIECFRLFDEETVKLKNARTDAEVTSDKQVITYPRLQRLKLEFQRTYNQKLKYGEIPEPVDGQYPINEGSAIFAHSVSVHRDRPGQNSRAPAPAPASNAPAPAPAPDRNQRRLAAASGNTKPDTAKRKYVDAKSIAKPVEITVKGKKRWIFPASFSSKEKDEFLGQNSVPKKKMKCRAGIHYNESTGVYQQCHKEHYTDQHAKLYPEQAGAAQVILEAAGQWRDSHPLANTSLSVSDDEWNSRAADGHFSPCVQRDYPSGGEREEPSTDVQEVREHYSRVQDFRRRVPFAYKTPARNSISFSTDDDTSDDTELRSVPEAASLQDSAMSQDEIVLFVACLFLFLASTWVFGSFTIFVTPMSTAAFTLSNSTAAIANWTPTASQCTLQSCFVLHSTLTVVACGLVLMLYPSLVVTLLTQLRIQVSRAATIHVAVPASVRTCNIPTTPRRKIADRQPTEQGGPHLY
jgi:hypothetical protein